MARRLVRIPVFPSVTVAVALIRPGNFAGKAAFEPSQAAPSPEATLKLLEYNPSAPLNLTQTVINQTPAVRICEIEYDSPRGGRVPGYLIEPRSAGRFAGIVFGHWGQGNRTEFIPEAIRYAQAGAVCVLIDYPWVRPEPWRRKVYVPETSAEQDRDTLAQAVVDLRRAIDLLESRPDV